MRNHRFTRASAGLALSVLCWHGGVHFARADERLPLTWTRDDKTDALSGEVTRRVIAETTGPNVVIQATGICNEVGFEVEFSFFHGDAALTVAGQDNAVAVRIRFDTADIRTFDAFRPHSNSADIVFYDPALTQAVRQAPGREAHGTETGQSAMIKTFVGTLYSSFAMSVLEHRAAGTMVEFATAKQIGLAVPLESGDEPVIDINPADTTLRQFAAACIQ